jgi:hypothetical protein
MRAVELVRHLLVNDFGSEEEADQALREVERMLPDPRVSDLIYCPGQHPLSAEAAEDDLTAERIVDLALRYEPFAG